MDPLPKIHTRTLIQNMAATQATNRSLSHHHHLKTTTMATHHLPHHQQLPTHRPRMAEVNTLPTSILPTPPTRHHAIIPCPVTLPTRTTDRPASRHRHHPATQTTMKCNQHHHLQPPRKHSSTLNLSTPAHLQEPASPQDDSTNANAPPRTMQPVTATTPAARELPQEPTTPAATTTPYPAAVQAPERPPQPAARTPDAMDGASHLKSQLPRHVPE